VCFTYPVLYRVSAESRAGEWELRVIDDEKSWSLRADARRRITLYHQTQARVSLQGTGSEPLGLGPSSSVENRNSLACLPGWQRKKYSTSPRNGNPANGNHLDHDDQSLRSSRKNRNSLTWVLVALTVCFTYPVLYRVSSKSRAGEWEL